MTRRDLSAGLAERTVVCMERSSRVRAGKRVSRISPNKWLSPPRSGPICELIFQDVELESWTAVLRSPSWLLPPSPTDPLSRDLTASRRQLVRSTDAAGRSAGPSRLPVASPADRLRTPCTTGSSWTRYAGDSSDSEAPGRFRRPLLRRYLDGVRRLSLV